MIMGLGFSLIILVAADVYAASSRRHTQPSIRGLESPTETQTGGLLIAEHPQRAADGFEAPARSHDTVLLDAKNCGRRDLQGAVWPGVCDPVSGICEPRNEAEDSWTAIKPGLYERRVDNFKLAILMVAMDRVKNKRIWLDWVRQAEGANLPLRLLIHPKESGVFTDEDLMQYLVKNSSAPTGWCRCVEALYILIREALQDENVTHMALVSDSTVPVKSVGYIYGQLSQSDESRFCMDWGWLHPRAETWWMMRREDLELIITHAAEHAVFLTEDCPDEQAWMRPLALLSRRWGADHVPLRDECVTMSDWSGSCKAWATNAPSSVLPLLHQELHTPSDAAHPRMYRHVGPAAWQEMVKSHFWFARKFDDGAIDPAIMPGGWPVQVLSA